MTTLGAGFRMKNSGMFGNKTVTLRVGQGEHIYTVLEDLICVSPYFRGILQPRRKAIDANCSICQDTLEGNKALTFCHGPCGNNFHQACVNEWQWHAPQGVIYCPLCRERLNQPRHVTLPLPAVDAKAFDVYYNWLYDQPHIRIPSRLNHLIKAYQLGVVFSEPAFSKDVLHFIQKECVDSYVHPGLHDVTTAYDITSDPSSPLREFMVRTYMQLENLDYIVPKWETYPDEFRRDLAAALMQARSRQVQHWN
jgi:hypothetical protein